VTVNGPATRPTARLAAAMPGYRHCDEFAALVSPAVAARIEGLGIRLGGYPGLAARGGAGRDESIRVSAQLRGGEVNEAPPRR